MIKQVLALTAIAVTAGIPAIAQSTTTGDLSIDVTGARNDQGVIRVALYGNRAAYSGDKDNTGDGATRKAAVYIRDNSSTCTFKNLPYGDYAIKVFHDED